MFRVALCDDNSIFLQYEKGLIEAFLSERGTDYECSVFSSGDELIALGEALNEFNIVILDYQMDGLTGFETARKIHDICSEIPIAFATNFYDFTREGYKYGAVRFLVKQEATFEEDLRECLEHVMSLKTSAKTLVLPLYDSKRAVDVNDIIYISSEKHYVRYFIRGEDETHYNIRRISLDEAAKELPETFVRIHQRYIVNICYAVKLHDHVMDVKLLEDKRISLPVARTRAYEVDRQYCLLKGGFN